MCSAAVVSGPELLRTTLAKQQDKPQELHTTLLALDATVRGWTAAAAAIPPVIYSEHPAMCLNWLQHLTLELTSAADVARGSVGCWSLAVSCLKASSCWTITREAAEAAAAAGASVQVPDLRDVAGNRIRGSTPTGMMFAILQAGVTADLAASKGSQHSSSSNSSSCGEVPMSAWQLLAARAVYAAGALIGISARKQQQQAMPMQQPPAADLSAQCRLLIHSLSAAVTWLGQRLPAPAVSPDTAANNGSDPLQQQQARLSQALQSMLQQHGGSEGSSSARIGLYSVVGHSVSDESAARMMSACRNVIGADVAQQLLHFGAAVCALLPSKLCCNALDCCCCERLSEAELVGGKMSQCSGCKTARWVLKSRQHALCITRW
jgi:hypothetical protein